jgi:predicted alpha/beta hydrolase family esterase
MHRYLVIPGLNGSGPGHWQRWWLADHSNASILDVEDWQRPRLDVWLGALEAALASSPGCVLVAHSLGAILVANLAGRPSADHVAGALLVAPSDLVSVERLHPGQVSFGTMPQSELPFPSIVVASRDDPYLKFARAQALADRWGSGLVDLGAAGHVNVASGFGRWTDGYALASGFASATVVAPRLAA